MTAPPTMRCAICGHGIEGERCRRCHGAVLDAPLGRSIRPGRRWPPRDFVHGVKLFFATTIHLLTRPEYFGQLGAAVLISGLASSALAAALAFVVHPGLVTIVANWSWLTKAATFAPDVLPTVWMLVVGAFVVPGLLLSCSVAALDTLALTAERMLGGPDLADAKAQSWRQRLASLRTSSRIFVLQLVLLPVGLVLALWPLGLVLALLVAAFLIGALWLEVPFARRDYDGALRLRISGANWARVLGFGTAFELLACLPLFNLLLLAPTAAVAATVLYFHLDKNGGIVRQLPPAGTDALRDTPSAAAETWKDG